MELAELDAYVARLLDVSRFRDYCPNGMQVEGRAEVRSIVTGVTASLALLEQAAAERADAVLVHHGWFWRNEDPRVTGMKRRRLACVIGHGMSLLAYHLPLDAHAKLGNNARLATKLGLRVLGRFGEQDLGFHGVLARSQPLAAFAGRVRTALGREPLAVGDPRRPVRRVAWCTGGAQGYIDAAADTGVDLYLTGEASEQTVHVARERDIAFIAAGHHATERYGIEALGNHLARRFRLQHRFIDVPNPV